MVKAAKIKIKMIVRENSAWKSRFHEFYSNCEIKKLAPQQKHAYFAAYAGCELAGHSVIYFENNRWIMDGLRVKPEFRQRGIAKRLTKARIRHAVNSGVKEVWYSCDDGNLVTICCHLGLGFKKICPDNHRCGPTTSHWYRLNLSAGRQKKTPWRHARKNN